MLWNEKRRGPGNVVINEMKETKSNILKSALKLFNEKGYLNVRLQHIADEAFISVGNLAYHFENKQEILLGLYQQAHRLQKDLLHELNIVPLFEHLDRHWCNVFEVQQAYRFLYFDTLEVLRSNSSIQEQYQGHVAWEVSQLIQMLRFNLSRGALAGPGTPKELDQLAHLLWLCESSWYRQCIVRGQSKFDSKAFRESLWSILWPYCSETGRQEYKQVLAMEKLLGSA